MRSAPVSPTVLPGIKHSANTNEAVVVSLVAAVDGNAKPQKPQQQQTVWEVLEKVDIPDHGEHPEDKYVE